MNTNYEIRKKIIGLKDYLSISDVVLTTGFSVSTIRRAKNDGYLKSYQPVKPNGKILFKRDDLENWLEGRSK
jgi:hypothetical protein|tara:strand:+ start:1164 stop:1379 length:216 start_codon:yes stop_codon:yes gene_type:complete